jgi:hypothetical protein
MAEDIGDVLAGRPPRHRADWRGARSPVMALNVPAGASAPPAPPPAEAKVDGTVPRALAGVAGVILHLGIAGMLLVARRSPTAAAPSSPSAQAEAGVFPTASPSSGLAGLLSALQGEKPAQLAVDLEHPLRSVTLRIWVDGELAKEERVAGRITKKVIGLTLRKGVSHEVIEVKPGRHDIQVQVAWDDGERTERISATFKPETTRRLDVTLGRLLKDLTLEWR